MTRSWGRYLPLATVDLKGVPVRMGIDHAIGYKSSLQKEESQSKPVGPVSPRLLAGKLDMLDYAEVLADLASPPGNRLEMLQANLAGFHSIRINDQWRIVFRWTTAGPEDVDIVDYH